MDPNAAAPEPPPLRPAIRNTMVGCLTFVTGFFGGGMMAVLVGKVVDALHRCTPAEGLPTCGRWELYALTGGAFGAIFLPTVVLIKLGRKKPDARNSVQ
jgi:hypothetical protein